MNVLANEMHTLPSEMSDPTQTRHSAEPFVAAQEHGLPVEWNSTATDYPHDFCVHHLLEAQVQRTPTATAVEFEGRSLSYAELDARANQLGNLLRKRGVEREVLVGVCIERSLEMVVALLGILKAGGAYVPLDPAYPSERIKYVLEDAHVKVLVTQQSILKSLPVTAAEIICLDPESKELADEKRESAAAEVCPADLAYVIYTSGSTGKPKGVQVEHRSVVNFLCSMRKEPGIAPSDALVAVTTICFDIAGLEMYLPLLAGARLVIASRDVAADGRRLMQLLNDSQATVMQATPATWRLLLEAGWQGSGKLKVLVGGEALSPELARELAFRCASVWNMYGPTETTIWSALYRVTGRDERSVPIGRPIANTTLYVLDQNLQPLPSGGEGELYIGGEGLARGYFERSQLTAERFVADPFSPRPRARMYRTGDLARFRSDGNVEFLGRLDHQVKLRGFRIELGEIEAVLEQHPAVHHAVVIARDDASSEKHLVAYLVPEPSIAVSTGDLRAHVQKQLPDYMVPSAFVQLATLPLTPNGKVDRKALPAPRLQDLDSAGEYVAPRNQVEKKLALLWEQVLGVRPIGVTTSFFDLGGRSLLAARLFMKISRVFGQDLPLATLFRAPTIEQLAKELTPTLPSSAYSSLVSIQAGGSKPPFFCVHGGAGSTLFLHGLARELGLDQPFYSLEAEGLDGNRVQRPSVEQMAAHYLSEIRKVQPQGRLHIGGYCFGGLVAFEMAQQLHRSGEQAPVLALFSAALRFNRLKPKPAPISTKAGRSSGMKTRLLGLIRSPRRALRWRIRQAAQATVYKTRVTTYRVLLDLGLKVPQGLRTLYVVRITQAAERNYLPQRYPGRLILFRGRGLSEYENDPNIGWDGLAEHIENHEIGDIGQHTRRDIMNQPLVKLLAKELTVYLDGVQAGKGQVSGYEESLVEVRPIWNV
ncbi:MAG: amino acid adenylation protein [Acidobacteria bacterium]|nr:MAG: amino acid adenylation protein [Acidobacteriota bacterium]